MTIDRQIRLIVGLLILMGLGLAYAVNPLWLWFVAFVGANLIQSSLTGFCPMEMMLKRIQKS